LSHAKTFRFQVEVSGLFDTGGRGGRSSVGIILILFDDDKTLDERINSPD